MSSFDPDQPRRPRPHPSVYEKRIHTETRTVAVPEDGRLLVLQKDGTWEPVPACCDDPGSCERPQCWRVLGPLQG
jgi:hypothetical protein